jgi:hypothetical protein
MKKVMLLLAGLALVATSAVAQTAQAMDFKGTLIDNACFKTDMPAAELAKHTKDCALMDGCVASGYVVVTADGHVYKLDAKGNESVVTALKAATQAANLKVTVTGVNTDGTIAVTKVVLDK